MALEVLGARVHADSVKFGSSWPSSCHSCPPKQLAHGCTRHSLGILGVAYEILFLTTCLEIYRWASHRKAKGTSDPARDKKDFRAG